MFLTVPKKIDCTDNIVDSKCYGVYDQLWATLDKQQRDLLRELLDQVIANTESWYKGLLLSWHSEAQLPNGNIVDLAAMLPKLRYMANWPTPERTRNDPYSDRNLVMQSLAVVWHELSKQRVEQHNNEAFKRKQARK